MTLGDINNKITALTGAETTAYLNSDRVIDINVWFQNVVGMILDAQDETDYDDPRYAALSTYTIPLTTNRKYDIPTTKNLLKIKRLDITYDGTNYYRAEPVDGGEIQFGLGNETIVDGKFDKASPRYEIRGQSILIYPRANATDVAAGGQMVLDYERAAMDFTEIDLSTGTIIPGVDYNFHIMLALGPAYEYCSQNDLADKAKLYKGMLDGYEVRLRRQYGSKQTDRELTFDSFYSDTDFQ